MISQAMKDAEAEITKRVKNAKAEAEEAKLAELEKLRKKHDMLSMSLEEDAKRKTKSLQDELDAARQKAAVYTHTHVCVCVCVCTRVHMYIHIHMYIRLYVYRIFWGSYSSCRMPAPVRTRTRRSSRMKLRRLTRRSVRRRSERKRQPKRQTPRQRPPQSRRRTRSSTRTSCWRMRERQPRGSRTSYAKRWATCSSSFKRQSKHPRMLRRS